MSLADYLAKKYLTVDLPEKKSKKRKRKDGAQSGFIITDDDASGWETKDTAVDEDNAPLNGKQPGCFRLTRNS